MAPLSVLMVGNATSNALRNLLRLTIRSAPASTRQVLWAEACQAQTKRSDSPYSAYVGEEKWASSGCGDIGNQLFLPYVGFPIIRAVSFSILIDNFRRASPEEYRLRLQQLRRLLPFLSPKHNNPRYRLLQSRHQCSLSWRRRHHIHPRLDPLRDRKIRHSVRHAHPGNQTRPQTLSPTPNPSPRSATNEHLRLHRTPQAFRSCLRRC